MSCWAGLDNYCHLWDVSVPENQTIMMSGAHCLPPNQHPVTKRIYGFSVSGNRLYFNHIMGCTPEPFGYVNQIGLLICRDGPGWVQLPRELGAPGRQNWKETQIV